MIHLWLYRENRRNFPGYHLSADAEGCARLSSVFASLSRAIDHRVEKISLMPVTVEALRVPNNSSGDSSVVSFAQWVVETDPALDKEPMRFEESGRECRTRMSPRRADEILAGVKDISAGRGDYSIGSGDHALWFWWQVTPNPALKGTRRKRRAP